MRELCLACVGILLEAGVFFCVGSFLMKILKMKEDSSLAFILGYLMYFSVFEVVMVPMTLLWVSLTTAALIWAAVMTVTVLISVLAMRKTWIKQIHRIPKVLRDHSWMLAAAAGILLLQCLIVVLYEDTTLDASYYVGTVSTSVYTDTLARYNPFNGALLKVFQARYVFSAYPMNNAVWCRILGIHPIVQSKIVMSCMNILTANFVIYQIGKKLFDENKKRADLMMVFVCILQLFCGTIYSSGTFFFTRSYEGKAILANISIPMVLFCAVWLLQEKKDKNVWIVLFLTAVSALTFSGSAIIFPVAIAAGMAPAVIMSKKIAGWIGCAVCMLPSAVYAVVFFACRVGWLTLAAS